MTETIKNQNFEVTVTTRNLNIGWPLLFTTGRTVYITGFLLQSAALSSQIGLKHILDFFAHTI